MTPLQKLGSIEFVMPADGTIAARAIREDFGTSRFYGSKRASHSGLGARPRSRALPDLLHTASAGEIRPRPRAGAFILLPRRSKNALVVSV
jgi:hypothetical protein